MLKGEAVDEETTEMLQNTKQIKLNHESISLNDQEISFVKLKQKEIFFACLYPTAIPTSVNTWSIVFETDLKISD